MSNEIIYRKNSITNADIVTGNCLLSHAMTGDTLASDTLDFRIWSDTGLGRVDADFITRDGKTLTTKDGKVFNCFAREDYTDFVPGSSLEYKRDNKLVGKFFLRDVKRTGKYMYDFSCVSAIGILGDTMHYGGIYTGETVAEVAGEILDGLPYEIDPIAGDIKLYGWLPFDTKRNNLQQITIATAIAVRTLSDGSLLLTALSNDIKGNIGTDRMAIGGNVEVDTPYSAVQVAEHYFQTIDDEVVLFSESSVKTEFLKFREPIHSLTVLGGTIIESGANYAIVECNGFTEVVGKRYLHTERTVAIGDIEGLPSDKVYNVNNATLITSLNSSGVAQKLYEAYTKPKTIQADVFWGNEKASDVVKIINPYTLEVEDAFLKKQDINISKQLLANSDFIVNFMPSGSVAGYKNRVLITEDGEWEVPEGVTEIRAMLVGGGGGGQAGTNGARAQQHTVFDPLPAPPTFSGYYEWEDYNSNDFESYNTKAGDAGIGGVAGLAGKVFDTGSLDVSPGAKINITVGNNGTGGISNGDNGTNGTPTSFASYSSDDGERLSNGYTDLITGQKFALPGADGFDGAKGRGGDNLGETVNSLMPVVYEREGWETKTRYCPPMGTTKRWEVVQYGSSRSYYGVSGSGGGCSYNSDGGMGTDGGDDWYYSQGIPGNGGRGADGGPSKGATVYGGAGFGGHGAGGGGGHGWRANPSSYSGGTAGGGGIGGPAGDGMQGCVIIYY